MEEDDYPPYSLPPELIQNILSCLWAGDNCLHSLDAARQSIKVLLTASCTCKAWHYFIEKGWSALFLSYWTQDDLEVSFPPPPFNKPSRSKAIFHFFLSSAKD